MKYLILLLYIALYHWVGNEFYEGVQIAFLGGIVKAIGAGKEQKLMQGKADALNPIRPIYDIPQEMKDVVSNSYNMAQGDMAGYGRAIGQAQGTTANQLGNLKNFASGGAGILQNLALAGQAERGQMGNINTANQQFKQQSAGSLNQALQAMAGYQDQAFQYNESEPYMQQEADKRAFESAATDARNAKRDAWGEVINGVVNTGLSVATGGIGGAAGGIFGKMFGKK